MQQIHFPTPSPVGLCYLSAISQKLKLGQESESELMGQQQENYRSHKSSALSPSLYHACTGKLVFKYLQPSNIPQLPNSNLVSSTSPNFFFLSLLPPLTDDIRRPVPCAMLPVMSCAALSRRIEQLNVLGQSFDLALLRNELELD